MVTRVGTFEVCVPSISHYALFIMQVLTNQLHFLANRNAVLAIPPFIFWPVDCRKIKGHVAHITEWPYCLRLLYTVAIIEEERSKV